jgi:hypothetical protein
MSGEWPTYRELGARRRALRARWTRQSGNDDKARVLLPHDYEIERRPDGAPDVRPDASVTNDGLATLAHALESYIKTLQADNDALKQDLAAARADLAAEQARTTQAIEAFSALAERLEAMAEAKRPPWWQRLLRVAG